MSSNHSLKVWWPEWMISLPPYCQIFRIVGFVDPSLPICHEARWVFHKLAGPALVKRAHRRQSGFEKAAHQFTSNINAVSPPRPLHLSQLQLSLRRQILNTQILCQDFQGISTISLNHEDRVNLTLQSNLEHSQLNSQSLGHGLGRAGCFFESLV